MPASSDIRGARLKVKFITSMTISQAIGAAVLSKAAWDGLTDEGRKIVTEESQKLQTRLGKIVKDDNVSSLKKMQAQGIQVIETPPEVVGEFEKQARLVAQKLEGQLYSHEFRMRVEKMVADNRAAKK